MTFKYVRLTNRTDRGEQYHQRLLVRDYDKKAHLDDYCVISDVADDNRLRQQIAILRKHAQGGRDRGIEGLELSIMRNEDGKGYRLLTYCRNWKGRASYYAGIILGVERMRRSRRKRKKIVA